MISMNHYYAEDQSFPELEGSCPLLIIQNKGMLHRSELIPQPRIIQKNGSNLSDKSKELSRSSVSSKCLTTEESLQGQIVQLKEKAHQSFMQVMYQMQQLHEEELEELRSEFAEKERQYQRVIAQLKAKTRPNEELELRVKQLQFENINLQKNFKHHNCEFIEDDLSIDNIELITCREESKLDDSAIINFTELINLNQHDEQVRCIKEEIRREVAEVAKRQGGKCEETGLYKLMEKLFGYLTFMREEYCKLQQKGGQKDKQEEKSSKVCESLQKESKFMTEHIKRLSAQKMKVEKKLLQTEREVKNYEQKIKRIQSALIKRGIKLQQLTPKSFSIDHDPSPTPFPELSSLGSPHNKSSSNPIHKSQYGLLHKSKN